MKYIKFSELFKKRKKAAEIKVEPLTDEQEIEEIVNKLILKLKDMGYSIALPQISKGYGGFSVSVHLGENNEDINIWQNITTKPFDIHVKPHFTEY